MSTLRLSRPAVLLLLLLPALSTFARQGVDSNDIPALLAAGKDALSNNRFREAARAFQRVVDLNPSSVRGNEGLGVALSREILSGNVRPSNDSETVARAENYLKQATQLSPSSPVPLLQLAELESLLASRTPDPAERKDRYSQAQEALKQVIALNPSDGKTYLRLANLERDEFGPPVQQAQARSGQQKGPLPDVNLRAALRRDYEKLMNDALGNALQASNMNGNDPRPMLLLSRIYRERAVLRDTPAEYAADMSKAADWQRQFLAVGGHLDSGAGR